MKKTLLLIALVVLISTSTMYAQILSDYVKQVKGDTLVIKTYDDMGGKPDAAFLLFTTIVGSDPIITVECFAEVEGLL